MRPTVMLAWHLCFLFMVAWGTSGPLLGLDWPTTDLQSDSKPFFGYGKPRYMSLHTMAKADRDTVPDLGCHMCLLAARLPGVPHKVQGEAHK